jgi:hypothetical protein
MNLRNHKTIVLLIKIQVLIRNPDNKIKQEAQ